MSSRAIPLVLLLTLPSLGMGVVVAAGGDVPAPASRPVRLALGVDLGLSFLSESQGGADATVLAWPGYVGAYLPALRLGILAGRSQEHEFYLKSGYLRISDGGALHLLSLTGNYQFAFPTEGGISPYATAGGGIVNLGGDGDSETVAMIGGGAGGRFRIDGDHGALRFEARVDHVSEGNTAIDATTVVSFLFGFELWMR